MSQAPAIFEIKGNALDDGPGIRSVVFFKGCPLSCVWCHNPEGKHPTIELGWDRRQCVGCGACLRVCPQVGAEGPPTEPGVPEGCTRCFACVPVCPAQARKPTGQRLDVDEVVAAVVKDQPFFAASGGGVTLSGGEPTMFLEFAGALASRLHDLGIHVCLETCGHFDRDRFLEVLYPHLDLIYFDLKIIDPEQHRRFCGRDNGRILENFRFLYDRFQHGGVEVLPRVPLIPDHTTSPGNLTAIAALLREAAAHRVALLPYHPFWQEKLSSLGFEGGDTAPSCADQPLAAEVLERCRGVFSSFEVV